MIGGAVNVLLLCYAKFFLYNIGKREISGAFSAKVLHYGDMQKNFCLITS
jgi:hypothetical protein